MVKHFMALIDAVAKEGIHVHVSTWGKNCAF